MSSFWERVQSKHMLFCILQFLSSTTSTVSLCMSTYGLAYNIHTPWAWQHYTISGCIVTTIIVNAIKDALVANPKIFAPSPVITGNHILDDDV